MKLSFKLIVVLILFSRIGFSQTTFERQYGNHSLYQSANSIEQTFDGGYIISGTSNNFPQGTGLPILMKIDMYGDSVWSHELWGQALWYGMQGIFYVVHQLPDSGFIVGGFRRESGNEDFFITRTNINGDTIWNKLIEDSGSTVCRSICSTSDGGFISDIIVNGHFKLIKFDAGGNINWIKPFYYYSPLFLTDKIQQTSDNGYVLSGTVKDSIGSNNFHPFIAKFNSQGDSLWTNKYGANSSFCYDAQQTSDSGFILCGIAYNGTNQNVLLIKTDASGNFTWSNLYGGTGIDGAYGYAVKQTADNGFIVTGSIDSLGSNSQDMQDLLLVKTDYSGNQILSKSFNRLRSEQGSCVQQASDGGFIICGSTSDVFNANEEIYVIKTDDLGNVLTNTSKIDMENINFIYPNPSYGQVNIQMIKEYTESKISITNSFGQSVTTTEYYNQSNISIQLNGPPGIYFITVETPLTTNTYKILKF